VLDPLNTIPESPEPVRETRFDEGRVIHWLLQGDVSVQYQVHRDLLDRDRKDLQDRIATEGWGRQFLSRRHPDGHWGDRFYQPKWKSTHYTLLDLRNLDPDPEIEPVKESIGSVLDTLKAGDGGIRLGPSTSHRSDVCVNGMFLNYASYFGAGKTGLRSVVDSILNETMPDGGFNCRTTRSGATHSSLHTTISVLEGFLSFLQNGYTYRKTDILEAMESAEEFILAHRLFLSDRTGEIIHKDFLKLRYPCRWKYDILRALDYFHRAGSAWDERMGPALNEVLKKRNRDGTWNVQAHHPGDVHFVMEQAGRPSRWNTLRARRVIKNLKNAQAT